MGEAKRRKAINDMYGMGKLPESAHAFVLAMQEMVELQARMVGKDDKARNDHQLFLDGVLKGESGVYGVGIPVELFDFSEHAFTASINALTGFMGVTRFGMVIHSSATRKKTVPPSLDTESSSAIMMLACIDGTWFYNMINDPEKGAVSMPRIGDWYQGKIKDLAVSEQSNRFMSALAETLKKSRALQDNVKATMTLEYLKEHYRARVSTPHEKRTSGEVLIN